LKTLNLSHNLVGSLDAFPPDLQSLLVLDVSHNRLRNIARDSLTHLQNLIRIDLRGNLLSELMPEVLLPLKKVRALDLASNQFSTLPLEGISSVEDTLESVHLEGKTLFFTICGKEEYFKRKQFFSGTQMFSDDFFIVLLLTLLSPILYPLTFRVDLYLGAC
jgi:hypothetical protein